MNVDFRNQNGIKVEIEYRGRGMIDRIIIMLKEIEMLAHCP